MSSLDPLHEILRTFYHFAPYFLIAILFVCAFYIFERYLLLKDDKPFRKHDVYLFILLGFTIRVFLAYYVDDYTDIQGAETVTEVAYSGGNVYRQESYLLNMPYAPFWILLLLFWKHISIVTGISFAFLFKFSAIITDTFFMFFVLLFPLIRKEMKERQNMVLLLAFSPVVISNSAVFGQFDIIPTLLSFLAFLLLLNDNRNWKWAALCLGFGIYAKTFPIVLLPAFLTQFSSIKRRISFSCIAIAPVTLSLLIAAAIYCTPQDLYNSVICYKGMVGGSWGFSGLFWMLGQETLWNLYNNYGTWMVIVLVGIGYFFLFKKVSLIERIIYTYFVFYVFSNAVAPQYLVWILPFLLYGNFTFASGFHFWSNLTILVYIPFTVGGIFHLEKVDKLFPLVMGFLWIYSLYCLVLIIRHIWEKWADPHKAGIHSIRI